MVWVGGALEDSRDKAGKLHGGGVIAEKRRRFVGVGLSMVEVAPGVRQIERLYRALYKRGRLSPPCGRGLSRRGRSLLEGQSFAKPAKAETGWGRGCKGRALPSETAGSKRNPITGRPGSGGRPLRAASYLTRTHHAARSNSSKVVCGSEQSGAHSCVLFERFDRCPSIFDPVIPNGLASLRGRSSLGAGYRYPVPQ